MEEIVRYLSETGFAVLIAVYLLVRMEKKIENLTDSIKNLNQIIDKLRK